MFVVVVVVCLVCPMLPVPRSCPFLIAPSVFFNVYFIAIRLLLTRKLLNQALPLICLNITEQLCHKSPLLCSVCRNQNLIRSPFITFHQVCEKSNTLVSMEQEVFSLSNPSNSYPQLLVRFVFFLSNYMFLAPCCNVCYYVRFVYAHIYV